MRRNNNNNNEFSVEFVPAGGNYQQKRVPNQNRVEYTEPKRKKGFIAKLGLILALIGLIAGIFLFNIGTTLLKVISISRQKAKQKVYQETVLDEKENTTITPEELAEQLAKMNNSSSPVVKERRNW